MSKTFENAVCVAAFNAPSLRESNVSLDDVSEGVVKLLSVAAEVDLLAATIERDARDMAARFTEFADEIATTLNVHSSPTDFSTMRSISTNLVRYATKREILVTMVTMVLGADAAKAYRAELNGG